MKTLSTIALAAAVALGAQAHAGVCDYRPSQLLGGGGSGAVAAGSASVAATGIAAKAAGFYTLTHAVTGATMLGSTAGGVSAAGTVGIMGGTAGLIGTAGAILMAPVTIAAAATTSVAVGGLEAWCYYKVDERIVDYAAVHERMASLAERADPEYFRLVSEEGGDPDARAHILLRNADGSVDRYDVENLYIVNGELRHTDWFRDTRIGLLHFVSVPSPSK